jgi:hypothetical protein
MRLKQRIVRILIKEVIADVDNSATEIVWLIHWTGGRHSELRKALRTTMASSRPGNRTRAINAPSGTPITATNAVAHRLTMNDSRTMVTGRDCRLEPIEGRKSFQTFIVAMAAITRFALRDITSQGLPQARKSQDRAAPL